VNITLETVGLGILLLISYNNYRFQGSKKFPFASVANVTQTKLQLPLKSQNVT
jgi:hypothetical protein